MLTSALVLFGIRAARRGFARRFATLLCVAALIGCTAAGVAQTPAAGGAAPDELTLLIRDTPGNLARIEQIIRSIDVPPKQVLIEAQIFDIALSEDNSTGIDWSTVVTQLGRTEPLFQYDHMTGVTAGNGALKFGTLNSEHFTMLLRSLKSNKRARSLSNPKVTAMNGRNAQITVGQKIPYNTTTTYPAQGGNPPYTVTETKFENVPITLDVTPTIYDDGTMRLRLRPEITAVVSIVPNSAPWTETRKAETEVIVRDGETLILGGLITENRSADNESVPIFNKIPMLKKAFARKTQSSKRSELVVFITPNIITSADTPERLREAVDRHAPTIASESPALRRLIGKQQS